MAPPRKTTPAYAPNYGQKDDEPAFSLESLREMQRQVDHEDAMKKTGTRNADLEALDEILDMARQSTGKLVEKRSPKPTPAVVAEAEAEDELREAIEEDVVDDNADAGAALQAKKDASLMRSAPEVKEPGSRQDFRDAGGNPKGRSIEERPVPESGEDAWASAALRKYLEKNKK